MAILRTEIQNTTTCNTSVLVELLMTYDDLYGPQYASRNESTESSREGWLLATCKVLIA
jgi:hypothetical protein